MHTPTFTAHNADSYSIDWWQTDGDRRVANFTNKQTLQKYANELQLAG